MSQEPSPWRSLGGLATVGMTFVVATAGATIGGYFLDRWLGTNPLCTLIGLALGIGVGCRDFFRTIRRWQDEERDGR